MSFNLATILRESARSLPDNTALINGSDRMSYAELDAASDRMAVGLGERGMRPGDAVAVQLPNVAQFAVAYFGILKAGCVAVPMDVGFTAPEAAHVLRSSGARLLITWAGCVDEAAKAAADVGITDDIVVLAPPGMPQPSAGRPFAQLLAEPPPGKQPLYQTDPGDPAVIAFTAGATGAPKGAELTHFHLFLCADIAGRLRRIEARDRVMVVLPLHHVGALACVLDVAVRFGATMTLLPAFEPGAVLEAIERDRVTVFEGVPGMYLALLNHPGGEGRALRSLRLAASSGGRIPARAIDAFERRFGVAILEGYGLTETAWTIACNPSAQEHRVESVGKPVWGVVVQIRDVHDHPMPPGRQHVGELVVRAVTTMRGYRADRAATDAAIVDGWFRTGDLGYLDEDGFLFVVGRKTELIRDGAHDIHAREVEDALRTHPAVADVAVVGMPRARPGEQVRAYVELRHGQQATETEIIDHARKRLASYMCPRSVEFRNALPKNAAGKILKWEL
jgi:long-chain acyl-CoA synthetase